MTLYHNYVMRTQLIIRLICVKCDQTDSYSMWLFRRVISLPFTFAVFLKQGPTLACFIEWKAICRIARMIEPLQASPQHKQLRGGFKWLLSTSIIFFFFLMYNLWPISPPVTPSSDASMPRLLWADRKCCRNGAGFSCLLMCLMRGVRCKWLLWEYACLFHSNMRTCWSKWNMAEGHQSEEGAVYTVITFMD